MMSVPAQLVQVPLRTAALDEDVDPKQAPPGVLLALRNAVWKKSGRVEKRDGTVAVATTLIGGGSLSEPVEKLLVRDRELVGVADGWIYSRIAGSDADRWKLVDEVPVLQATWTTCLDTMSSVDSVDLDANENGIATAWISGFSTDDDIYVQMIDPSGSHIVQPMFMAHGKQPRVFLDQTKIILFYLSTSNVLTSLSYNYLTGATEIGDTVADIASGGPTWDASKNGSGYTAFYKDTSDRLRLVTFSSSLGAGAPVTVATDADARWLSVDATAGESVYAAYTLFDISDPNETYVAVHDPSTLAQSAAPVLTFTTDIAERLAVSRATDSSCVVALSYETDSFGGKRTDTIEVTSTGSVVTTSRRRIATSLLISKPFTLGERLYVMLTSTRPAIGVGDARVTQNTTFAVHIDLSENLVSEDVPLRLAAVIAPREGGTASLASNPSKAPVSNNVAYAPAYYVTEPATFGLARNGLRLVEFTEQIEDPWRGAQVGRSLVLAGAVTSVYDGRSCFEVGFLHPPHVITADPTTGGFMDAGDYQYVFVYEWRDVTGLLHRSAPSQPATITVAASGRVDFVLEPASTTGKCNARTGFADNALSVRIVPYRTKVGGTTFYRCAVEPADGVILNDPLADTVSWSDESADDNVGGLELDTRPVLYTTGGFLDEVMPPAFLTTIQHRGRVLGVAGDRRSVWPSKDHNEDPGVFPGFHENLRITFEEDIVALASLDDKLVAFSEGSIWVVFGDGPNAAGQGSFEPPIVVQSDAGAVSPRGVVETPDGVMFLSQRGIYVLTRSLEVKWAGREVRDQLESYPVPLDAVLVPHLNQVRFEMSNDAGTAGVTLVFDYVNRFWSVFDYYDGESEFGVVRSPVVLSNRLYFVSGSQVVTESSATSLDLGTWVTLEFEFMIRPIGPIAWQHVRRLQLLGERRTHHDLRLRLAFDDRPSFSQDFVFTAEMVATNNDCPSVRIGSQNGANPKSKSIRLRVTDVTPTNPGTYPVTTGKGGWFSAIGLELIPKPGLPRHGARHSKV